MSANFCLRERRFGSDASATLSFPRIRGRLSACASRWPWSSSSSTCGLTDRLGERLQGPATRSQTQPVGSPRASPCLSGEGWNGSQARRLSGAAFRWSAATGRDRTRSGGEPGDHPLRRAHFGAGSRARERSAGRHARLSAEGRTMIVVTHEVNFARDVSHRVLFLHDGRIEEEGTPAEVLSAPRSRRLADFLGKRGTGSLSAPPVPQLRASALPGRCPGPVREHRELCSSCLSRACASRPRRSISTGQAAPLDFPCRIENSGSRQACTSSGEAMICRPRLALRPVAAWRRRSSSRPRRARARF